MEQEIWKDVVGFEGMYQVSNLGRIKSLDRIQESRSKYNKYKRVKHGRILSPFLNSNGYHDIRLHRDAKSRRFQLHRLIAEAFIPNPDNKPQIDHINTIRNDNRVENLRWATNKENSNNPLTCLKKSISKMGHTLSNETKMKLREKRIGKLNPFYGKTHKEEYLERIRKVVLQLSKEGDIIKVWKHSLEAAKALGINDRAIRMCCNPNGRLKTYKGYKWIYKEDYDNRNTRKAETTKARTIRG